MRHSSADVSLRRTLRRRSREKTQIDKNNTRVTCLCFRCAGLIWAPLRRPLMGQNAHPSFGAPPVPQAQAPPFQAPPAPPFPPPVPLEGSVARHEVRASAVDGWSVCWLGGHLASKSWNMNGPMFLFVGRFTFLLGKSLSNHFLWNHSTCKG